MTRLSQTPVRKAVLGMIATLSYIDTSLALDEKISLLLTYELLLTNIIKAYSLNVWDNEL